MSRLLGAHTPHSYLNLNSERYRELSAWSVEARAAADRWQAEHDEWVRARLDAGLHPDLDPVAFGEFRPAVLPEMPDPIRMPLWGRITILVGVFVVFIVLPLAGVFGLVWFVTGWPYPGPAARARMRLSAALRKRPA
jgi:hypothetical protein